MTTHSEGAEGSDTRDTATPVLTEPEPPDPDDEAQDAGVLLAEDDDDMGEAPGERPARSAVFSAETFALSGILVLLCVIAGTRLTEILPSLLASSQEGLIAGMVVAEGAAALLAVLLALLSITLVQDTTRPWASWLATATIIVGVLLAFTAAGSYIMVPEPQPQAPAMPTG